MIALGMVAAVVLVAVRLSTSGVRVARTASAGFSCIPITSLAGLSSRPRASIDGSPKRTISISSLRASRAPATISAGPRSPPIASTAMRAIA